MWNTEIYCLVGLALLVPAYGAATENNVRSLKSCNATLLTPQCSVNERCIQNGGKGLCDCIRGYERLNENCVPKPPPEVLPTDTTTVEDDPQPASGGNSVAAGLLIPTFLIVLGVLIFFGARRYKWVQRFREYRQNRYGNVLVTRDDDDDDPPIA
ncbi:uncharacterized protein LOC107271317 isoform X2 [Cephus cinctus]|uniref:Uncharacterized protein LOC107271317 isoform X2 n=1 Tax=Cephus cinctus TaxID=211228 RepID=A0AAJ7C5V6_CEPCN|nr:uncharacterized protein LOC107271317 isoform X2 [Cephus cinctus]